MANCFLHTAIWLSLGNLVLPIATAPPSPGPSSHAPPARARARPAHPPVCFTDVFAGPLPGKADYCLGMRDWDQGHYRSGMQFLQLAAGWGDKNAQYTLGLIHYNGHHVPTNVALGLAWLKLADERHNDPQISRVARATFAWATPTQRERAERLFQRMQPRYGDKVAAARAWHHLQHWRGAHDHGNSGCVRVYGAQAAAARRMGLAGTPPNSINALLYVQTGTKAGRPRPNQNAGACVTLRMRHAVTQHLSEQYFAGTPWVGSVTVEPLQQVPAAPSSPSH